MKFRKPLQAAFIFSLITIIYNLAEGAVSTFFGSHDETLALFGFGVDSFAEVLSGVGIAHMIIRMRKGTVQQRDGFEVTALRITGIALCTLAVGLVVGAVLMVAFNAQPHNTNPGIIIAVLSILTMYLLYKVKLIAGEQLDSAPIISDAKCTKTCFYFSFILLASSLLYELFQIPYIDAIGSLGIAWYALKEGREALVKAKTKSLTCGDDCC